MRDFAGRRTAMFGKTRLGKSNVVKLLAQGMLDATVGDSPIRVGQLIFDLNGEYANDNPQDGSRSIRSANEDRCTVYTLTPRGGTPSKPLRLNFYAQPDACMGVIRSMLERDGKTSNYIKAFASVELPDLGSLKASTDFREKRRAIRRVQAYWAILHRAGFAADEDRLRAYGLVAKETAHFCPGFADEQRQAVGVGKKALPNSLDALAEELEAFARHARDNPSAPLKSSSGGDLFNPDDRALLNFLAPAPGSSGPTILAPYRVYHDQAATNFVREILRDLDAGRTIILDLGNATGEIRQYFSDLLSREVFAHQEAKFVGDNLASHFAQLYFEEAHNLFPIGDKDLTGPYARFAKEGAKFHIGMVYSTQSPSTINRDLLAQTENFFVGHLSSEDETKALTRSQGAFAGIEADILRARTPGYMRMLTQAHRFVIPVQAHKFEARAAAAAATPTTPNPPSPNGRRRT